MKMFNSLLEKITRGQYTRRAEVAEERRGSAPNEIFDNVVRTLGNTLRRRDALKLVIFGITGAALADLGVKTAWAAENCLCRGQVYDPATACCTPSGVQAKHPVTNLAACPNKTPHPGYVSVPNGCGPAGGAISPFIPERWGRANFGACCNDHDNCYGSCNSDKGNCDDTFFGCLRDACNDAYLPLIIFPSLLASCLVAAGGYYTAVSLGGGSAYDAAQRGACDCCGTEACPQTCAGGTCSSLPPCGEGGCVCFQTVEGTGFCHRSQSCAGLQTCSSSSQCPSGWACVNVTCCGSQPICIQPCTVIGPAFSALQMDGPTTTGYN